MLSWNDEADIVSKRGPLNKAGSLTRPGSSFEAQRTGSSRKSVDVPIAPGTRKQETLSPMGSLGKANSLLRSPGQAAEGTIGAEGWWHHMDHSQMNEPPTDGKKTTPAGKEAAGFVPQFGITGQKQSLWADEVPASAAPPLPSASSSSSPAAPTSPPGDRPAAATPTADPAAATNPAPVAPAAAPTAAAAAANNDATIQNAAATGWWAHMDNSILNQPAEAAERAAAGEVHKGERVMGGGFTPQFNIAGGGNRYRSIFDDQEQQQELRPREGGAAVGAATAAAAAGEEGDWSGFASAPKA